MLTVDDIRASQSRIAGKVRRTPMIDCAAIKQSLGPHEIVFKPECLQVTGSFKARGAISKLTTLSPAETERGLVTASGGNHGLAIAYAGWLLGRPSKIFVPKNVSPEKATKIRAWGADLVIGGDLFDDANRAALAYRDERGATYVHPFKDPAVIAGQGTTALEILEDDPTIDTILVAIGGGGLISGISTAAKAIKPGIRIIGIEPVGAPTLHASLAAGHIVELADVTTRVPTMAARKTEAINFEIAQRLVDDVVLVTDDEMKIAAEWLWFETGLAVDLSGAAAVAALMTGRFVPPPGSRTCALVCGAGSDGMA